MKVQVNESRMLYVSGIAGTQNETVDEAKEYLANNPIQYIAPRLNPTEETIELPTIPTNAGTNIIEIDTNISPSNMEVEYYAKGVS